MPAGSLVWRSIGRAGLVAVSRWALEISMPTNMGAVFIGIRSEGDPGVSRPCYAAWWPGDCSGSGREETGAAARAFLRPRWAGGVTAYRPYPHVMAACPAARRNIQGGSRKSNSAAWSSASRAVWTKSRRRKRSSESPSR